jgi:hypothetical protein
MGKRRTKAPVRRDSGNRFVWVNTDVGAQEASPQIPPVPEKRNPVVWTDAGFAVPAVAMVTTKHQTYEETPAQMTEANVPKTCGSKLCRLLSMFACFGSTTGDCSIVKPP